MFLLKKIIAQIFFPVPLCLELILLGALLVWRRPRRRAGRVLMAAGILLLFVLSNTFVARILLHPLEHQYLPMSEARISEQTVPKYIVVLGGAYGSDPAIPITSWLGGSTMNRLVEGIRLHREWPTSKLVVSAGKGFDTVAQAEVMRQTAEGLGVNPADIVPESESRDTEESARMLEPMLGKDPFVLVTSASHMPRSMGLFRKLGMNPIAAPADFKVKDSDAYGPGDFFPSSGALANSEGAFYEYLGLAWCKITGKI